VLEYAILFIYCINITDISNIAEKGVIFVIVMKSIVSFICLPVEVIPKLKST